MRGTVLTNIGDQKYDIAWVNNPDATAAPTVNDDSNDGYSKGSTWIYNNTVYTCFDATPGAAVWVASSDTTPGTVTAPAASTPTGTGGAASITGGAGGSTSGNGGSSSLVGGAASAGNGNGGDAIVQGGAKNGTGVDGVAKVLGIAIKSQGAPAALTAAATLTAAQLLAGIITGNLGGAAPGNYQLPAAADLDTALPSVAAGESFDFSLVNISTVAAEDITVTTNAGWSLVGGMIVNSNDAGTSISTATFRARKTGAGAWTLYRIS